MIKSQKLVPEVYYKRSRDFQLFGRIYDLVFNYLKNNTLAIEDLSLNTNPNQKVLALMCNTLGFKTKHDYNNNELSALCSIFIPCIRNKGTIKAIKLLLYMVCSVDNSQGEPKVWFDPEDNNKLMITLPNDISDWTLIQDVLDYIIPAGTYYSITNENRVSATADTKLTTADDPSWELSWNIVRSSVIKATGKDPDEDIVNYNISIAGEKTETTTNPKMASSQVFRANTDPMAEADMKRISSDFAKAIDKVEDSSEG